MALSNVVNPYCDDSENTHTHTHMQHKMLAAERFYYLPSSQSCFGLRFIFALTHTIQCSLHCMLHSSIQPFYIYALCIYQTTDETILPLIHEHHLFVRSFVHSLAILYTIYVDNNATVFVLQTFTNKSSQIEWLMFKLMLVSHYHIQPHYLQNNECAMCNTLFTIILHIKWPIYIM